MIINDFEKPSSLATLDPDWPRQRSQLQTEVKNAFNMTSHVLIVVIIIEITTNLSNYN